MNRPLATSNLFSPLSFALTTALAGALAAVSPVHAAPHAAPQMVRAGHVSLSAAPRAIDIDQQVARRTEAA